MPFDRGEDDFVRQGLSIFRPRWRPRSVMPRPTIFHKVRALTPGDSVAVIAPAGPFDRESFEAGLAIIAERYRVQYTTSIFQRDGYLAGNDQRRLAELVEALGDPCIRGIFCARGGYGTMRLLRKLPLHPATAPVAAPSAGGPAAARTAGPAAAATVAAGPAAAATVAAGPAAAAAADPTAQASKAPAGSEATAAMAQPIVGFSDITALHQWRQSQGWVSIHGPVLTQLSRLGRATCERLFAILESDAPAEQLHGTTCFVDGVAEGPLLGGNLSVFTRLLGTPFMPPLDGAVLMLEDVGERPYRLDRMWTHLELAGVFGKISGIALGSFTHCEERDASYSSADTLKELAVATGLPCAAGFPIGHGDSNAPVPLGVRVRLNATTAQLSFLEPAVSRNGRG